MLLTEARKEIIHRQVKVIKDNTGGSFLCKGDTGTVKALEFDTNQNNKKEAWVAVEFDFEFEEAHDCDGHCSRYGYWIPVKDLELL